MLNVGLTGNLSKVFIRKKGEKKFTSGFYRVGVSIKSLNELPKTAALKIFKKRLFKEDVLVDTKEIEQIMLDPSEPWQDMIFFSLPRRCIRFRVQLVMFSGKQPSLHGNLFLRTLH